jgi:hypothetical protein
MIELPIHHPGIGNGGCRIGVGNDAAGFVGEEEESLVALLVDFGYPNRTADGASEVVIAQGGPLGNGSGGVVEKAVGVENVIAEELVNAAVNIPGSRTRNHVNLCARRAAGLRIVRTSNDAEFTDRINAGKREERQIGAAVDVVGAVNLPIVFLAAAAVDLESHRVGANRGRSAGKDLVRIAGIGSARDQEDKLGVVATVKRELFQLGARNHASSGCALGVNGENVSFDGNGFVNGAQFESEIGGNIVVDVENNASAHGLLEAGGFHGDAVAPDGQERRHVQAMFVRSQRTDHDLLVQVGDKYFAIRDDSSFRVRNCTGNRAGNVLTETRAAQTKDE